MTSPGGEPTADDYPLIERVLGALDCDEDPPAHIAYWEDPDGNRLTGTLTGIAHTTIDRPPLSRGDQWVWFTTADGATDWIAPSSGVVVEEP